MDATGLESPDVLANSDLILSENEADTYSGSNQNVETGKASLKLENIKLLDCLYNAAVVGKTATFNKKFIEQLVTPNKNTILHIYITALSKKEDHHNFFFLINKFKRFIDWRKNSTIRNSSHDRLKFVEQVLAICPGLLWQLNNKDETLLHIAARHGHDDVVEFLIDKCKETWHNDEEKGIGKARLMLKMKNLAQDTALHEAVRFNHHDVVHILIKEDPDHYSYGSNGAGETPFYLAAERGYHRIVLTLIGGPLAMLELQWSLVTPEVIPECLIAYGGPNGRTALHAAVLRNDFGITWMILLKESTMTKIKDEQGWIPLHYAADCGYTSIVRLLLDYDESAAYKITDNEKKTALHIAAGRGEVEIMKELISRFPCCCELVDERRWNVLHFAMESMNSKAIKLVLENPLMSNLINEDDSDGNTPLHQLAALGFHMPSFIGHPKVDKLAFNKQNLNALDITLGKKLLSREQKHLKHCLKRNGIIKSRRIVVNKDEVNTEVKGKGNNKDDDTIIANIKKARESYLVVAALIATVTFAAGVTVPGGYKGAGSPEEGTAILTRSVAFKLFVITDSIAMMLSSSAVFLHLFMALDMDDERIIKKFIHKLHLTILAMYAMVFAFISGTYAILAPSAGLAIAACVLGCIFFLVYSYLTSDNIFDLLDLLYKKIKSLRPQRSEAGESLREKIRSLTWLNRKDDAQKKIASIVKFF